MNPIERLQEAVASSEADLMALNPGATMRYLTGGDFTSHERLFLLLVPGEGDPTAIVPALEESNWHQTVPEVPRIFTWQDSDGPGEAARQALSAHGSVGTVAVEPLDFRFMEVEILDELLPGAKLINGESLVQTLRLRKTEDEAAKIRGAAEIAEAALEDVLSRVVKVGATEAQIAAALSSELLARGGEGISFGPIVLGGEKSALPHGVPDDRALAAGEFLLIDYGTAFEGYHCDITRTFVVGGEPSDRMREVYEAVRRANELGKAATKPGVTVDFVHNECQKELNGGDWEEFFKHRTGHGLGLEIHEPPSVMDGDPFVLEEGVVITIEPGLYLEGWGGVRIEDDIRVTADGCQVLTSMDRALRVVGT